MSSSSIVSKLLIIPPVMIGAAVLWYAVARREPPAQVPASEVARNVRVITVEPRDVAPKLVGYGSVTPENIWTGIAQISGRVVYVNPQFRRGALLEEGTEIVRISPVDYRLSVAQAEANIRSAEAVLTELGVNERNTAELLRIEEESLALKKKSVEAKRALLRRGSVAQLSFDAELRDMLTQKKKVQDLRNALRLLPTQKAVQQEQIEVNKSKLADAKLDLERTVIRLPFKARIASVDVEISQYVQSGSKIGVADAIGTAEITAHYSLAHIRDFFDVLRAEFKIGDQAWDQRAAFGRAIGLYTIVRLRTGERDVTWRGRVARVSDSLDVQTRTIGLITVVDGPYAQAKPGIRPPLVKGMFVEVELRTKKLKQKVAVPDGALHGGKVYVVGDDSRLVIRDVATGYKGDGFVVIDKGLDAGERLIVSDISPAVPGMLLKPTEDKELQTNLASTVAAAEAEVGQ